MQDRDDALRAAKKDWALASKLLLSPCEAAAAVIEEPSTLPSALRIFLAYMAASVLFYGLIKPPDFAAPNLAEAGLRPEESGLVFWAKVEVWSPLLTALCVVLTAFFSRVLGQGRLFLRLAMACAYAALPLLLLVAYKNTAMPRWTLACGLALLAGLLWLALRRAPSQLWRPLSAWMLAINALNVALLPLFCAAVWLNSPVLYQSLEILLLFLTLGWACCGVSRITGLPAARAFCAVFLATLGELLLVFALYMLGCLPKSVLKALLAA